MNIRSVLLIASAAVLAAAPRPAAQLAAPNPSGISMSELHFIVPDVDAERKFWLAFGGEPVENAGLQMIQFPGVEVIVTKGDSTGGTVGSVTNHIGFQVKDIAEASAKWKAAGMKVEPGARPTQVFVTAPFDVRIEILEDKSLQQPIVMHHVHEFVPAPKDAQAWYVKTFGASAAVVGPNDAAVLPGVNILFAPSENAAPNHGRVLDHVGLEVKNLEAFCKKLEAAGVKLDRPYTKRPNSTLGTAFFTDPWGTYLELTENLAPPK
jgi:catechol 2,3-dioxygenase-like lactoylglutathione lyase family enzyme